MTSTTTSPATVRTRLLGRSGIRVGEIGLGLWAAGGGWGAVDERETLDVIDAALDAGVNFHDTADVYGGGLSESLLGRAMKGRRERFVVATKIGWTGYDGAANRSAYTTVRKVEEAVELALRRLGTDYIDVLQNHVFYREPNTDVVREAFQKLREKGKIRAWGVSTGSFDFLKDFASAGDCHVLQVDYSILNRDPEREILPWCLENGVGVIVRGPLAMGILTGKLSASSVFGEGDHRRAWLTEPAARATFESDMAAVQRLGPLARGGRTLAQAAMQFVLRHPAVSTAIPGARSVRQLRDNAGAAAAPALSPDELALIDSVVPPGGGRRIWPA